MRRWLVGLALALVVAGCQEGRPGAGSVEAAVPGASTNAAGRRALEPPAEPPDACTARGTTDLLERFFAALAAGRVRYQRDLDQFVAPVERFQWYAIGVPPAVRADDQARDRASLLGYLQGRQARHERIVVDVVDFNGDRDADRTANFAMLLRRAADDIRGGWQRLGGKGAVDCDSHRLMVVAIGRRP